MSEPIGAKLFPLLLLGGAVFFLFSTGKVSVPWSYGQSNDPAAKFQDLNTLAQATNSSDSVVATQGVFALLDTAEMVGGGTGALLIRRQLPPLAARIDADGPRFRERLSALDIQTAHGRKCRKAFLRLNEEKRWLLHTFAADVAHSRSTWPVVRRFRAHWRRWVRAQGSFCNVTF